MQKIVFGLSVLVVCLGSGRVMAIDPLPPEIEKASLEKKAAYWQRTSRESGEQRAKVAQQRYDAALVYKRALLSHAEERLQRAEARFEAETKPSEVVVSAPEGSSVGLYVLLAGVLGAGAFLMHRQMKEADQPV
ncbi:MAG: hypothetical protein JNN07_05610 [Verrucomicrobiales bacterium]|nr:hypothetical protein [Verrucomicrobiales bacterium]